MISKNKKELKYLVILIIVLIIHGVINYYVLKKDNTPFIHDIGDSYIESLEYYKALKGSSERKFFDIYSEIMTSYPPLNRLTILPFYFLFDMSEDVASFSNYIYLIITVFAVYSIGKKIFSSECGLYSAILLTLFTGVFSFSRVLLPDFPLMAIVSLSIAVMLNTNYFNNSIQTILFGILIGLGMLTKWTFFIYLIGPGLIYFLMSIKINKHKRSNSIKHLIIAGFISFLISLTWYYNKINFLINRSFLLNQEYSLQINGFNPFTFENFVMYSNLIYLQILTGVTIIIFLLFPLILFIKNKWKYLLFFWIIVPYIFLSFNSWKFGRYMLPIMPSIAIIFVMLIMKIFRKSKIFHYRRILSVVIFVLFINLIFTSFSYREKNELISEGLKGPVKFDNGLTELNDILINESIENEITVVALTNIEFISQLKHKSYVENYYIEAPFFCIGHGGKYQCGEEDYPYEYYSGEIACKYDYILVHDEEFDWDLYNMMFISNQKLIQEKIVDPIISEWDKCKSQFEKIHKIPNLISKYGKKVDLYLYKKNN